MKRKHVIKKRLILVFALAALITALVCAIKAKEIKEPEGVYILREDAGILYTYLYADLEQTEAIRFDTAETALSANGADAFADGGDSEKEAAYLTLEEAQTMFASLKEKYPIYEGEIAAVEADAFPDNHGKDSSLLADDFLDCYERLWSVLHQDTPLSCKQGVLLAEGEAVKNLDDTTVSENTVLLAQALDGTEASETALYKKTALFSEYEASGEDTLYRERMYLESGEYLLLDVSDYRMSAQNRKLSGENEFTLQTCWISSNQPEALWVSFEDYQICIQSGAEGVLSEDGTVYDTFEDIADLHFKDGGLLSVSIYQEKVSGKLLSVTEDRIELEGAGFFSYRDSLPVYKLYGQKEYYTKADLKIGYDFTDFVLDEDGVIVAGLVTREEKMDSIRVVIKTTGFASAYHESISFTCDTDFLVNEEKHEAGEEITVSANDPALQDGRIYIRPDTNLAKTTITSIERDQGTPSYRGNFEIAAASEGLLLINELLLEEYLYSVVPSEMPASYPAEALKAQAISARTYAYQRMLNSGLKEYGAHVDDSAAFQVYNNIKENENTTLAIRETQGQIVCANGELAQTYYYSTSCGYGTDLDVWHSDSAGQYSYLVSKHIGTDEGEALDMTDEATFRAYITAAHAQDYEQGEAWYRWTYQTALDVDRLNENLAARYQASAKSILVFDQSAGAYESGQPPVFSQIVRMEVVKRESGGAIDELVIEGEEGSVKVVGEHAVRAVLANEADRVTRQDGSESTVSTLLPSAFAVLDVQVDSDTNTITAYTVTGGGYGHGIGMSQNGARAMALAGFSCENILQFFYDGVTLMDMYE